MSICKIELTAVPYKILLTVLIRNICIRTVDTHFLITSAQKNK